MLGLFSCTELLPPNGVKMIRVCHVCITVQCCLHKTGKCLSSLLLGWCFLFFRHLSEMRPHSGLPHYPASHAWWCRADHTATLGLPRFPFLVASPLILGLLAEWAGLPAGLLIWRVRWGGLLWCRRQFSGRYLLLVTELAKNLPAVQETPLRSLDREDPLEKEMATHPSILAWKIPWTEELGGLQSMRSQESNRT